MPFDALGCTCATMQFTNGILCNRKVIVNCQRIACCGLCLVTVMHEIGITSKRSSLHCADYVPALCTHRPSLLPIGRSGDLKRA
jgi:hypothetical protein